LIAVDGNAKSMIKPIERLKAIRLASAASLYGKDYVQIKVRLYRPTEGHKEAINEARRLFAAAQSNDELSGIESKLELQESCSASKGYNRADSGRLYVLRSFQDITTLYDEHCHLWPAHYLDAQLRATGPASDRLYGHELSSFLRDYHRMTLQRNLPATAVRFRIANWVTMRKTQAQIYILFKELADMAHHIFDF
jgi:hypothetical protein